MTPNSPEGLDEVAPTASKRVSLTGLTAASGFLVCLFSLSGFAGRWSWLFEITSHFRVQYAVILGGLALLFLWMRRHRTSSAFLGFSLLNAWLISPFLFGSASTLHPDQTALRLLSWNVNSSNRTFDELPRLLEAQQPDLVLLMEIDPAWEEFLVRTMTNYPHRVIEARDDNFGIALFSKAEPIDLKTIHLGAAELPSIAANLSFQDREITLIGTHPLPPAGGLRTRYRDDQLHAVADWVTKQTNAVVLAGDLNATPWSPAFADLLADSGLRNSAAGRGLNGTWPAFFPPLLIPIDHVLVSDKVIVMRREILSATGSDHLPQLVDLRLP